MCCPTLLDQLALIPSPHLVLNLSILYLFRDNSKDANCHRLAIHANPTQSVEGQEVTPYFMHLHYQDNMSKQNKTSKSQTNDLPHCVIIQLV